MNASSSRRRRRAVPSYRVVAALFFAATATAVKVAGAVDQLSAAVASALPDPSPSLRSAGDTLYTTLKSNATTIPFAGMGSPNGTSAIKSEQWMNMCSRAKERRRRKREKALLSTKTGSSLTKTTTTETLSAASHAVTNALSAAKNPLGDATIETFMKIDAAEFAAWNASAKTCNASVLPKPKLSFAFQGKSRFGGNEGKKRFLYPIERVI